MFLKKTRQKSGRVRFDVCAGLVAYGCKASRELAQKTFESKVDGLTHERGIALITDVHGESAWPPADLHGLCYAMGAADLEFVIIGAT